MKSRLVIIGLMICSVLAISVSAQQLTNIQQILQDDKSGDHLIIAIPTGEYKFESCTQKLAISGVGSVSIDGCKLTFKDFSDTRRVVAEVDLCAGTGKADILVVNSSPTPTATNDVQATEAVLSDANTRDSTFDCTVKQILPNSDAK